MAKFIEVSDKYKKYTINTDNILEIYSIKDEGVCNTRIRLKQPIFIYTSGNFGDNVSSFGVIEKYEDIKSLLV